MTKMFINILLLIAFTLSFTSVSFAQSCDFVGVIYQSGANAFAKETFLDRGQQFIRAKDIQRELESKGQYTNVNCEYYNANFNSHFGIRCTGKKKADGACEIIKQKISSVSNPETIKALYEILLSLKCAK